MIHAELGLLELNARERGTDPMPEAVSHADFAVGAQAAGAILAALFHRERSGQGQYIDVTMAETMLAINEFSAIELNGGFGEEISPFRPGKAALLKLADGTWVQVPGNPTTWIFGVAKALGRESELQTHGWHTPADTQGQDDAIRAWMQSWAGGIRISGGIRAGTGQRAHSAGHGQTGLIGCGRTVGPASRGTGARGCKWRGATHSAISGTILQCRARSA